MIGLVMGGSGGEGMAPGQRQGHQRIRHGPGYLGLQARCDRAKGEGVCLDDEGGADKMAYS